MALVRHWRLQAESSGTTVDEVGGKDGTLGPTYPSDAPTIAGGVCSAIPNSLLFDGSNDLVTLPAGTHSVGNVLTLAAWVYPKDLNRRTFYSATTNVNQPHMGVSTYYGSGSLEVLIPSVYLIGSAAGVIVANKWHHIAWTRAGSAANQNQFYVNGKAVTTSAGVATLDSAASNGWIGCRFPGSQTWNGYISEVSLYDSALTAAEVWTLYEEGLRDNAFLLGQP